VRVLIVSSHTLIAHSLVAMLQSLASDEPVQAAICDPEGVLEHARDTSPEVVLVEAAGDTALGLDTVRLLRSSLPELRTVLLGTQSDEATVFEGIRAGAHGYLAKDSTTATLVATLRGVARGELGLPRAAALRVIERLRETSAASAQQVSGGARERLTRREAQVFELVRKGLRSRDIALRLCIAETTVNKHIQNVLGKLHVHSRAQAILAAEASFAAHSSVSQPGNRKYLGHREHRPPAVAAPRVPQ